MRAEIAIVGAGPVGCALALLLRASGRTVALAERRRSDDRASETPRAARPIALSHASRIILERAGAWDGLAVTPIQTVHVSQAGGFGQTRLTAADALVPALGYVIAYDALATSLRARVAAAGVAIEETGEQAEAENDDAPLVVHAEGVATDADEKRYGQTAVAALVGADPRAGNTAYERFTPEGPLALLPLAGAYGIVWATRAERAAALVAMPDSEFLESLQRAFGARAGRFVAAEGRGSVPLALRVRAARIERRRAYVGNSAQTIHPVAGQGLNLGLRDAWELSRAIERTSDPGDAAVLRHYAARRRLDAFATIRATDLLAGLFTGTNRLAGAARGAAMCALDLCAPARRLFARRMIFGPSAIP